MLAPDICPRCDFALAHSVRANRSACPECGLEVDDPICRRIADDTAGRRLHRATMWCVVPMALWVGVLALDMLRQYESTRSIGYLRFELTWPSAERMLAIAAFVGLAIGSAALGRLVPVRTGLATVFRVTAPLTWLFVAGTRLHMFIQEWWFVSRARDGSHRSALAVIGAVAVITGLWIAGRHARLHLSAARRPAALGRDVVLGAVAGGSVVLGYIAADTAPFLAQVSGVLAGSFMLTVVLDALSRAYGRPRLTSWLTSIRVAHYLQWMAGLIIALVSYVTMSEVFGDSIVVLNVSATLWFPAGAILTLAASLVVMVILSHRVIATRARSFQMTTPFERSHHRHVAACLTMRPTVLTLAALCVPALVFGVDQVVVVLTQMIMWLGMLWVVRWNMARFAGPIAWRLLTGTLAAHLILWLLMGAATTILLATRMPETRFSWWSEPSMGVGRHLRWLLVHCAQDVRGACSMAVFLPAFIAMITAIVITLRARRTAARS